MKLPGFLRRNNSGADNARGGAAAPGSEREGTSAPGLPSAGANKESTEALRKEASTNAEAAAFYISQRVFLNDVAGAVDFYTQVAFRRFPKLILSAPDQLSLARMLDGAKRRHAALHAFEVFLARFPRMPGWDIACLGSARLTRDLRLSDASCLSDALARVERVTRDLGGTISGRQAATEAHRTREGLVALAIQAGVDVEGVEAEARRRLEAWCPAPEAVEGAQEGGRGEEMTGAGTGQAGIGSVNMPRSPRDTTRILSIARGVEYGVEARGVTPDLASAMGDVQWGAAAKEGARLHAESPYGGEAVHPRAAAEGARALEGREALPMVSRERRLGERSGSDAAARDRADIPVSADAQGYGVARASEPEPAVDPPTVMAARLAKLQPLESREAPGEEPAYGAAPAAAPEPEPDGHGAAGAGGAGLKAPSPYGVGVEAESPVAPPPGRVAEPPTEPLAAAGEEWQGEKSEDSFHTFRIRRDFDLGEGSGDAAGMAPAAIVVPPSEEALKLEVEEPSKFYFTLSTGQRVRVAGSDVALLHCYQVRLSARATARYQTVLEFVAVRRDAGSGESMACGARLAGKPGEIGSISAAVVNAGGTSLRRFALWQFTARGEACRVDGHRLPETIDPLLALLLASADRLPYEALSAEALTLITSVAPDHDGRLPQGEPRFTRLGSMDEAERALEVALLRRYHFKG